jgi:hypothetical protein
MPCPEALDVTLEKLGDVTFTRAAGQPDTGRVKVDVTGPMPAGLESYRPASGSIEDYPQRVGVYRRIEYKFDGEETRCEGAIEYHVCFYKQTEDVIVHGHVLTPPRTLGKLKEVKEISGLCPEKILELILSAGTSLLPTSKLQARAEIPSAPGSLMSGPEVAKLLKPMRGTPALAERRISAPAFHAMVQLLGDAIRKPIEVSPPQCLESGWADLANISRDDRIAGNPNMASLFGHLNSVSLAVEPGTSPDEAWINESGWFTERRWANRPLSDA